jgi:CheY-like chemotaxis protein
MQGNGRIEVQLGTTEIQGISCTSCRQTIQGRHLELSVHDNGPGIDPQVLERMFEPFFSTKEVGKGSGMGLAMVHGIVHEHGGHVLVESRPGKGTRFRVLFPPLDDTRTATVSSTATTVRPGENPMLSGRVLVVDDDEVAGEFMGDLLRTWGLTATLLQDSPSALQRYLDDPQAFDLVVLDQTMPRMKGLELAGKILEARPELPVILYTGYSEGLNPAEVKAAGLRALIRKPVDPDGLLTLLRNLLKTAS